MVTFNHGVLRTWRLESDLSPEQVCVAADISYPYLRTLEDRGGNPRAIVLARLAEVYGRSLGELFAGDNDTESAGAAS